MARAIGYEISRTWCRKCAPEDVREFHQALFEGEDHGVSYVCDDCGEELKPCDHEWEMEWHPAYDGREIRFCRAPDCGEAEYREHPTASAALASPSSDLPKETT